MYFTYLIYMKPNYWYQTQSEPNWQQSVNVSSVLTWKLFSGQNQEKGQKPQESVLLFTPLVQSKKYLIMMVRRPHPGQYSSGQPSFHLFTMFTQNSDLL